MKRFLKLVFAGPDEKLSVLGRKIVISTFAQYAGKVVQLVLAILTLKLISNFLTEGHYGIYAKISEYALFFSVVANLGIFGNVVRFMADRPRDGSLFLNALILRIVTALVFFVSGVLYLLFSGADNVFLFGSVVFFGALFFDYITSVCDGMLQANYLMGRANLALVAGRIVQYFGTLYLLKNVLVSGDIASVWMLFIAVLGGSIVAMGLSLFFVAKKIEWNWVFSGALCLKIFAASLPFGIINIINSLYFRFLPDYFAQQALTDAQFGSFNVSFRIAQVASLVSTFLMFSVLPGFKQYIDEKHWHKAHALFKNIWKILLALGVLLFIGGWLFGSVGIELLTHKKYFLPEFWFVLPLMLFLAAVSYGYDLILIILFAMEEDFWLIKRELFALALALAVFGLSYAVTGIELKLLLIVVAAIAGESFMVLGGIFKIRKLFRKFLKQTSPEVR